MFISCVGIFYFIILFVSMTTVNIITVYEEMFNTVKDNMSKRNENFFYFHYSIQYSMKKV